MHVVMYLYLYIFYKIIFIGFLLWFIKLRLIFLTISGTEFVIVFLHLLLNFLGLVQQSQGVPSVSSRGGPFGFWVRPSSSISTPSLSSKKKKKVTVRVNKNMLFDLACHFCKQKWQSNHELQELLLESSRPGGWC